MIQPPQASRRIAGFIVACCAVLVMTHVDAAPRKKSSRKHRAVATAPLPDPPGAAGSIVRRSPWLQLGSLPNFIDGQWAVDDQGLRSGERATPPFKAELMPTATAMNTAANPLECAVAASGMPTMMLQTNTFEFVYEPGRILILLAAPELAKDTRQAVRRVYTDGRVHPENAPLTANGHSTGYWDKTTLVVDTVGIAPSTPLAPGVIANGPVHVVERIRLINTDTMVIDTTVDAPAALIRPWTYTLTYKRTRECDTTNAACGHGTSVTADAVIKKSE